MSPTRWSRDFAALRWCLIRHGPHDDRGFGLVTGLVTASVVIAMSVLVHGGILDRSWLLVGVSVVGLTWAIGPVLLPGSAPTLNPEWFRTLPRRPRQLAREMAPSEAISVGTVVTVVALSSLVVLAVPHGLVVIVVAVAAAGAQTLFLLWLGRCVAAVVSVMLRSRIGLWAAAFQMSALLAICFAGWVPVAAVILPNLGAGDTTYVALPAHGAVPPMLVTVLIALPTGWGAGAVFALLDAAPTVFVVAPVLTLLAGALVLREIWILLTARNLQAPPARMRSRISGARDGHLPRSPAGAVTARELKTWFRDPHRLLGLGHAWMTPLLMILLVAPTNWYWALPFVGVVALAIAGMAAVNTYALDGTALWQLVTTPGALRADVIGRQLSWLLLFGLPLLAGTILLGLISQSVYWAPALGMAAAATGAAAAGAPLFSVLMPALGADAR